MIAHAKRADVHIFQFASISHELRSALANIAQLADQLSSRKEYDDGVVNQIKLSSSFLLRIVEGVIDEDRNLTVRKASLDKMIEEVVSIRASDNVPLDIWISPDVPLVVELCDIVVSRIIRILYTTQTVILEHPSHAACRGSVRHACHSFKRRWLWHLL